MNRDYQAIKRSYGREIHAAGQDGKPACGTEANLRWFPVHARKADCRPCLRAASRNYAEGYADGYAVHLGLGKHDAPMYASQEYRDGAQDGRAQGIDDHLAQIETAGETPAAEPVHRPARPGVRRSHANCPSCNRND